MSGSKLYHITLILCTPYLIKYKTTLVLFTKLNTKWSWSVHLTTSLSNLAIINGQRKIRYMCSNMC